MALKLYGYWRSSAPHRVRIALNLKGLDYHALPAFAAAAPEKQPDAPAAGR